MYSIRNDSNFDTNRHRDLLVQSNGKGWQIDDRAKAGKRNSSQWFMWIVIVMISITLVGCDASRSQNELTQIIGLVTHVETGKDGLQVELETESELYSVTISALQAEIEGDFEHIQVGAENKVTGRIIDGMEPPLLVAEQVAILRTNEPSIENPLQGKAWVLSSYNDTQPIAGHVPTLNFDGDQVSGTTGCNHYGGMVKIDADSIRFEGIFSTEMACIEPDGLMEQERVFLELLGTADQFELIENVLTFYAKSMPILVFETQFSVANQLQAALDEWRESSEIAGAVLAIDAPGQETMILVSGVSDMEAGTPLAIHDRFRIGSITKTFVAAVVMQLAQEGLLTLDDPLSAYVPDFPNAENITVRHLLSHQSGIFDFEFAPGMPLPAVRLSLFPKECLTTRDE